MDEGAARRGMASRHCTHSRLQCEVRTYRPLRCAGCLCVYHQDVKKTGFQGTNNPPPKSPHPLDDRGPRHPRAGLRRALSRVGLAGAFQGHWSGVRGLGVRVSLALLGDLLLELAEGARDRRERAELALGRAHLG